MTGKQLKPLLSATALDPACELLMEAVPRFTTRSPCPTNIRGHLNEVLGPPCAVTTISPKSTLRPTWRAQSASVAVIVARSAPSGAHMAVNLRTFALPSFAGFVAARVLHKRTLQRRRIRLRKCRLPSSTSDQECGQPPHLTPGGPHRRNFSWVLDTSARTQERRVQAARRRHARRSRSGDVSNQRKQLRDSTDASV